MIRLWELYKALRPSRSGADLVIKAREIDVRWATSVEHEQALSVLGLTADELDSRGIEQACRRLQEKWHPDRHNQSPEAAKRFKQADHAAQLLMQLVSGSAAGASRVREAEEALRDPDALRFTVEIRLKELVRLNELKGGRWLWPHTLPVGELIEKGSPLVFLRSAPPPNGFYVHVVGANRFWGIRWRRAPYACFLESIEHDEHVFETRLTYVVADREATRELSLAGISQYGWSKRLSEAAAKGGFDPDGSRKEYYMDNFLSVAKWASVLSVILMIASVIGGQHGAASLLALGFIGDYREASLVMRTRYFPEPAGYFGRPGSGPDDDGDDDDDGDPERLSAQEIEDLSENLRMRPVSAVAYAVVIVGPLLVAKAGLASTILGWIGYALLGIAMTFGGLAAPLIRLVAFNKIEGREWP